MEAQAQVQTEAQAQADAAGAVAEQQQNVGAVHVIRNADTQLAMQVGQMQEKLGTMHERMREVIHAHNSLADTVQQQATEIEDAADTAEEAGIKARDAKLAVDVQSGRYGNRSVWDRLRQLEDWNRCLEDRLCAQDQELGSLTDEVRSLKREAEVRASLEKN
jgi:chromosome segregation ATPase